MRSFFGVKSSSNKDKGKNKEVRETYPAGENSRNKSLDEVRASFEESRIGSSTEYPNTTSGNEHHHHYMNAVGSSRGYSDWGNPIQNVYGSALPHELASMNSYERGSISQRPLAGQAEGFAEKDARKLLEEVRDIYVKKNKPTNITSLDHLKKYMNDAKAIEKKYKEPIDNIDRRLDNFQSSNNKTRYRSLNVELRARGYERSRDIKAVIGDPDRLKREVYDPLKAERLRLSAQLQHEMGPYPEYMRQDIVDLQGIKQAITKVVPANTRGVDTSLLQENASNTINQLEDDINRYIKRYEKYEPYYQSTAASTTFDYGQGSGNRYDSLPPA